MATVRRSGDRWRVGTQYYDTRAEAEAAAGRSGAKVSADGTRTGGITSSTTTKTTTTPTTTKIPYVTTGGTPEQLAAINANIDKLNASLAEGVTGLTTNDGTKINEPVYITPTGSYGGSTGTRYGAGVPVTTAPTNAGQIQPFGQVALPDTSAYTPGITNATAGMAGLSDYVTSQQSAIEREAQRRLAAEQANQEKTQSLVDRLLGNIRTPDEARTQAIRDTGIDPEEYFAEQRAGIKEIEKLSEEYNSVKANRDQQIAATTDRFGTVDFANNRIAQIERNAAPRLNEISANINAKAATLEALQGNYAQARQFINEAVAAATADAKFKFDMFSTFYSLNQDAFERTESIYREAYETSLNAAENEYNRQYEMKMQLGEWMIQYPNAGVTMSDTFQSAVEKVSAVAGIVTPGGATISSRTQQVLDGFTSISSLTPTEQAKVRDELYALGFGSDTAPEWFSEYVSPYTVETGSFVDSISSNGVLDYTKMLTGGTPSVTVTKSNVNEEWKAYQDSILGNTAGGFGAEDGLPDPDEW